MTMMPRPTRSRRPVRLAALVLMVVAAGPVPTAAAACWRSPVAGVVVDPFRAPACAWCPGNRGVEYRTPPGAVVRAVAAGTVTFGGVVAGTRYVVVELAGGAKVTYGRLRQTPLRRGDRVVTGTVVGTVGTSFHFGLRVGGRYVDPAPHLGRMIGVPRLVPADGSAPRAAPPPRLRCRE